MKKNSVIILTLLIGTLFFIDEFILTGHPKLHVGDVVHQSEVRAVVADTKVAGVADKNTSTGEALIGGQFALVDQNNNEVTDNVLQGKTSLVYFGFTNCPMICPTTLSNISLGVQQLPAELQKQVQVIFITVDPERDTPEKLKTFLANFPAPIIGLTGGKEQVERAEKAYRVFAQKAEDDKADSGIDHSSVIYIMDAQGKFISNLTQESTPDQIAGAVQKLLQK